MPDSVGQPLSRVDGRLKVTGRAPYSAEYPIPNLAYAVLITSSYREGPRGGDGHARRKASSRRAGGDDA